MNPEESLSKQKVITIIFVLFHNVCSAGFDVASIIYNDVLFTTKYIIMMLHDLPYIFVYL